MAKPRIPESTGELAYGLWDVLRNMEGEDSSYAWNGVTHQGKKVTGANLKELVTNMWHVPGSDVAVKQKIDKARDWLKGNGLLYSIHNGRRAVENNIHFVSDSWPATVAYQPPTPLPNAGEGHANVVQLPTATPQIEIEADADSLDSGETDGDDTSGLSDVLSDEAAFDEIEAAFTDLFRRLRDISKARLAEVESMRDMLASARGVLGSQVMMFDDVLGDGFNLQGPRE